MALGVMKTATAIALVLALSGGATFASAADPEPKSWAETVAPMTRQDGLLPIFVDQAGGRVLVRLPAPAADGVMARVIHHTALRTGVGSAVNPNAPGAGPAPEPTPTEVAPPKNGKVEPEVDPPLEPVAPVEPPDVLEGVPGQSAADYTCSVAN